MIFSKQTVLLLLGTFTFMASFSVEGHPKYDEQRDDRILAPKKAKKTKSPTTKAPKNSKPPTTGAPTTNKPTNIPKDPKTNPIDKTILTCSKSSEPTFCEAPEASINCVTLQAKMNECTAYAADYAAEGQFAVYDPNNCGDGLTGAIKGCNFGDGIADGNCRLCGLGIDTYLPCATGFYEDYYEPRNYGEIKGEKNQRSGYQTIAEIIGLPVQVDCDVYYGILQSFQEESFSAGKGDNGDCFLDSSSFEIDYFTKSFAGKNQSGRPIKNCPPQFSGDFTAYTNNARYQQKTTYNVDGEAFPKVDIPELAVGPIPALLARSEFKEKCNGLALGQEINLFDAGVISSFALTAKTMGERMLRPAYWSGNGLINCVNASDNSNGERCGDYSADTISNPLTYTNSSGQDTYGNMFPGFYEQQIPSAARPREASAIKQNTKHVGKQMHGKGQSCIYATFSFAPLKENYANTGIGDFGYIPEDRRVGLLDPKLANNDVTFDTMVRLSGNKNITTVKDVHDIRIRGFALKLFGVDTAFKKFNMTYNQIALPLLPAYDQPADGKYTFSDYTFEPYQADGTLDLLHVAVGTGELLGTGEALNDTQFDPTTEEGAQNPPDNVFVASNADNYYNGFILGGDPDIAENSLTDVYQNPLEYVYGSAAPFRAGPAASMKLSWAPCPGEEMKIENVYDNLYDAFKDSNFFYTNLKQTLQGTTDFKLCGYIQFQEDPCTEPLDNPTERWLTSNIKVFELTFPPQYVPEYNTFCDNTVYNPFRIIQEHQPQSFIQRLRDVVYAYASNYRTILNNGIQKMRVGDSIFESRGENMCPYGFDQDRWQPIPVGDRPQYQGSVLDNYHDTIDINRANGIIPAPENLSSSGVCQKNNECQLPFGPNSTCSSSVCSSTNDGLWTY